jgi:hypothetical protein
MQANRIYRKWVINEEGWKNFVCELSLTHKAADPLSLLTPVREV